MAVCGSVFDLGEKGLKLGNLVVRGEDALLGSSDFSLYVVESLVAGVVEELFVAKGFSGRLGMLNGMVPMVYARN